LWNFAPGSGTPLQYYLQDTMHTKNAQWGQRNAIFSAFFIPTFLVFGVLCRKFPPLLFWGTVVAILQMVPAAVYLLRDGRFDRGCVDRPQLCVTSRQSSVLSHPMCAPKILHVGTDQPVIVHKEGYQRVLPIELRPGAVVETIVRAASDMGSGLIAMPTEGRHGLSDTLFGTTTERVLHESPSPVLAVPVF
jgi:Universal stress protein family